MRMTTVSTEARSTPTQSGKAPSAKAQSTTWDPERYLRFADQRARPFQDLLARVGAAAPRHVVAPGGWFAMGVPGNFGAPSHTLLTELQQESRWSDRITGAQFRPFSHEPAEYLRALTAAGAEAEVWETTYYYVLPGVTGVLDFVS